MHVTGTSFGDGSERDFATVKYDASGDQLWSAIESFLTTDQAGRFASVGQRYSRARIDDWIDAAGGVGSTPLETAVATHKSEP